MEFETTGDVSIVFSTRAPAASQDIDIEILLPGSIIV